MWQQGTGGGCYVAAGCRRRLLCGSRVQEEAAMWQHGKRGGYYAAVGWLLCGRRVMGEAALWHQGTRGGCYVAAGYWRRLLCGSTVKGAAAM